MPEWFMNIWNDPVWSKVISNIIWWVVPLIVGRAIWRNKSNIQFIKVRRFKLPLMTIGTLIVLFGLILIFQGYKARNQKIQWIFQSDYLGMGGSGSRDEATVYIQSFQFSGINVSNSAVEKISGYLKNVRSGERFPLYMVINGNPVSMTEFKALPPGATIQLTAPFVKQFRNTGDWIQIPDRQFLSEFGELELHLVVDGNADVITFSEGRNRREIENFRKSIPETKKGVILNR